MDQLAASLVAETGLSPDAADAIAAEVRGHARERGFTCAAEAYAWLRVAARRRALDTLLDGAGGPAGTWADAAEAADQALVRIRDAAAGALDALPADEREVLRLRYVEGLLPDAIATRLGTTADTVHDRLAAARADAARALRPDRSRALRDAVRPLGAAVAAAAALLTFVGTPQAPSPTVPRGRAADAPAFALPVPGQRDAAEPVAAVERGTTAFSASAFVPAHVDDVRPDTGGGSSHTSACGTLKHATCGGAVETPEEIHVVIPGAARGPGGDRDVVIKQDKLPFSVCSKVPAAPPPDVASCQPARH